MKLKKSRILQLICARKLFNYISMSIILLNLNCLMFAQSLDNTKKTKVKLDQNPVQPKDVYQKKTSQDDPTEPNMSQTTLSKSKIAKSNTVQGNTVQGITAPGDESQVNPNPRNEIKNNSKNENDSKINPPTQQVKSGLEIGGLLAELSFSGEEGGRTNGSPWSSKELAGKAWSIWYVDPDERDLNYEAQEAFKSQNFPEDKIASIAMINMAATAVPNFILGKLIAKSQEEYKKTIYVKDYQKKGVKIWGMKDDSSCVLVLGTDGKLVFYHCGKLNKQDIEKMIEATKKMLGINP